jgi:hypothetical protein
MSGAAMDTIMFKSGVRIWFYLLMTLLCSGGSTYLMAQTAALDSLAPHERAYLTDAAYRALTDSLDAHIARAAMLGNYTRDDTSGIVYRIPVVVHVMHLPTDDEPAQYSSNPTEEQIIAGLNDLNDAFRNQEAFNGGPLYSNAKDYVQSVDTRIEFCLVKVDPFGHATTGITRTATELSDLSVRNPCGPQQYEEDCLRALSFWDSEHYLNLWLVNHICDGGGSSNCTRKGFAYGPSAHGRSFDGVVMESDYWGTGADKAAVGVRFFGYYLGLYDTYRSVDNTCENDNCLLEGDRVCDTPPDATPGGAICGQTVNTCHSDGLSSGPNPFLGIDVEDMYENFMDGGDPACKRVFTPGQMFRMRKTLIEQRASLLNQNLCESQGPDLALIELLQPNLTVCEPLITPKVRVVNTGDTTIELIDFELRINDVVSNVQVGYVIPPGDTADLSLNTTLISTGGNLVSVRVNDVNLSLKTLTPEDEHIVQGVVRIGNQTEIGAFPYCSDFNLGMVPLEWTVGDPDEVIAMRPMQWEGCDGSGNDYLLAYDALSPWFSDTIGAERRGTRDYLVSPIFDLREYGRITASFDVAFRNISDKADLRLRVMAGSPCGGPFTTIFDKSGSNLATGDDLGVDTRNVWLPATCDDWRNERIDLDQFAGQKIQLVFEVTINGQVSSNLYLENICLEAQPFCNAPQHLPQTPGLHRADAVCIDAQGWSHYYRSQAANPNLERDELLLSIYHVEGSGLELQPEQVVVAITEQYGEGGHDMSGTANYVENVFGWHCMGRYLSVSPDKQPDRPLTIRLYHDDTDLGDLSQHIQDPQAFGPDRVVYFGMRDWGQMNPAYGHAQVTSNDYREWLPGEAASQTRWEPTFDPNYHVATLEVSQLGAFGAGSGGDGGGFGASYPVALSPFIGWQVRSRNYLQVTVAREFQTESLSLYASRDGRTYEAVDTLPARGLATIPQDYELYDMAPTQGYTSYYVGMKHDNGMVISSDTIRLYFQPAQLVSAYPNPTNGEFFVQTEAPHGTEVEIQILDANKRELLVWTWEQDSDHPLKVDLKSLPPGIFFYRVTYQEQSYWGKVIRTL